MAIMLGCREDNIFSLSSHYFYCCSTAIFALNENNKHIKSDF
jgi:hypothetical protein